MAKIENPEQLLVKIAAILERLKVKYLVTGGFAVSVWGRPRATFDIDIIVYIFESGIDALLRDLKKIGKSIYIDEETARVAARDGRGGFNLIDSGTGLKVDFFSAGSHEFMRAQLKRRKEKVIDGQKVSFISPEDLILNKLKWYKESNSSLQLDDVKSIFKISGEKLDKKYLEKWAERLGLSEILEKITKF